MGRNAVKIKDHMVELPDWVMELAGEYFGYNNDGEYELGMIVGQLEYRLRELVHQKHQHVAVIWVVDQWYVMSYSGDADHTFSPFGKYQFVHFPTALEAWIDIAETEGVDEEVRQGGMINKYEETAEDQPVIEQGAKAAQSA